MAFKMVPKGLGKNSYGESPSSEKKKYSPTGEMKQIPGSDNPENFKKEGLGLFGFLSGGASKQIVGLLGKLKGFKSIKSGGKSTGIVELPGGKWTNSIKGVTSTPKKPAYGIDQYKYANTKGKSVVERIKNQNYAK
jgi:hypothetical protein